MELYSLQVFLTVATEKSFSRAAEKLLRTQPAVSLALQRLEQELGEKLIDRSGKDLHPDRRRAHRARLRPPLSEPAAGARQLRSPSCATTPPAGSPSAPTNPPRLYLLRHIERYRELHPKVKVQVRRSLSSKIPNELLDGNLELGVISYDPGDERLKSKVIYTDALAFVVSPQHRLARRKTVSITELGAENFIAHNVVSPYREVVLREFQAHKVPLQHGRGDAHHRDHPQDGAEQQGRGFLPRMCVEQEIEQKTAVRGAGQGDARGAEDPPGVSHAPRAEPRREGVPGSGGVGHLQRGADALVRAGPPGPALPAPGHADEGVVPQRGPRTRGSALHHCTDTVTCAWVL